MVCLQQCSRATLIKICVDLFNQKMTSLTGLLDQEVHLLLLLGQVQMPLEMVNNFIWNTFMFVHFQLSIRQHCSLFNQTKVLFNICVAHLHNDTIWMGLRNLGNAIEYYEIAIHTSLTASSINTSFGKWIINLHCPAHFNQSLQENMHISRLLLQEYEGTTLSL